MEEVDRELADPEVWSDREKANELSRERVQLLSLVSSLTTLSDSLKDASELVEIAADDSDAQILDEVATDLDSYEEGLYRMEFELMFDKDLDASNAYLDIQFGEGGTESQDWSEMLLRMYLLWSEKHGFKTKLVECSAGDVAGIRSATMFIEGKYAYGWLRTESGVHRLVRASPFDSNHRRHTSFASVYLYAEVTDEVEVEVNPADVRTDTYRASGAGGQHVNRTDSAVRLTHLPTNTVVQCQSERSQHQNRAQAWKQLRAKLYVLAEQERNKKMQAVEDSKPNIGFGSQIRSYVLDQSRVKDLRTNVEHFEPSRVLDGDLDRFLETNLKAGI